MGAIEVLAIINPVLLIVLLVMMVIREFNVTTFDYIVVWLVAFIYTMGQFMGVLLK